MIDVIIHVGTMTVGMVMVLLWAKDRFDRMAERHRVEMERLVDTIQRQLPAAAVVEQLEVVQEVLQLEASQEIRAPLPVAKVHKR